MPTMMTSYQAKGKNYRPRAGAAAFNAFLYALMRASTMAMMVVIQSTTTTPLAVAAVTTTAPVVGLENLGNTCYLNSQLQCAYHIPLVRSLILSNRVPHDRLRHLNMNEATSTVSDDTASVTSMTSTETEDSSLSEMNDEDQADICQKEESAALLGLRRLFADMAQSDPLGRPAAPRLLCENVGIPLFEQQDSQEFWKLLLPALELTELSDLYTGTYESYIVALDGSGRERRRDETFSDLSLNVAAPTPTHDHDRNSNAVLESLRQQFGQPELLSVAAGNAWRPEAGADKVDAHKGYRLTAPGLPAILQLHLKRFNFDWNTETTTKLNDAFTFPALLNLKGIVESDPSTTLTIGKSDSVAAPNSDAVTDPCLYELQAVVVHVGAYNSGHYYAYVRPDVRTDDWYRLNDAVVTKVTYSDVEQDAFGGKQESRGSSRNEIPSNDDKGNFLTRFLRGLFHRDGSSSAYGFGGPTSNAYVLQYVRRCDIPRLYDIAADQP